MKRKDKTFTKNFIVEFFSNKHESAYSLSEIIFTSRNKFVQPLVMFWFPLFVELCSNKFLKSNLSY